MAPKPTKPAAKTNTEFPAEIQPCIRCPSFAKARENGHHNDFEACQKQYPTLNGEHDAKDLWWGFKDGEVPNSIDLNKDAKELLAVAKNSCPLPSHMSDEDMKKFPEEAKEKKEKQKFKKKVITKGALEKAVQVVFPVKIEPKKETSGKGDEMEGVVAEQRKDAVEEAGKKVEGLGLEGGKVQELAGPTAATVSAAGESYSEAVGKMNQGASAAHGVETAFTGGFRQGIPSGQTHTTGTTQIQDNSEWITKTSKRSQASYASPAAVPNAFGGSSVFPPRQPGTVSYAEASASNQRPGGGAGNGGYRDRSGGQDDRRRPGGGGFKGTCHECGKPGHMAKDCPEGRAGGSGGGFGGGYGGPPGGQSSGGGGGNQNSGQNDPPKLDGVETRTNTKNALKAVRDRAKELISGLGLNDDTPAYLNALQKVIRDKGMRTNFADGSDARAIGTVVTNYVTLTPPGHIYVYQVEMIRKYDTDGRKIKVNKAADKKLVMDVVESRVGQLQVAGGTPKPWVSDGDLIWSVVDLFAATVTGSTDPGTPLSSLRDVVYHNECGEDLTVDLVHIGFKKLMKARQQVSKLIDVQEGTSNRDSTAAILLRGLNAFLTNEARERARQQAAQQANNYIFTGGQKCLDSAHSSRLQANSRKSDLLRCMQGFFLSSRPGIDGLLLNMDTVFSAFYGIRQTIHDFLSSAPYQGIQSTGQKTALLKGVYVRVIGPTATTFRFIHKVRNMDKSGVDYIEVAKSTAQDPTSTKRYLANELEITEYQPFHNQLSGPQTSAMIKYARKKPHENHLDITTRALQMFGLDATAQAAQPAGLFAAFDMSTGTDLLRIPGIWLHPPRVRYGNGKDPAVRDASWNLKRPLVFANTLQKLQNLPYINISVRLDSDLQNIFGRLEEALKGHGILRSPPPTYSTSPDPNFDPFVIADPQDTQKFEEEIKKVFACMPRSESPVLIVINEKHYDPYAYVKRVAELQLGVRTIFVTSQSPDTFNDQKASNIALKYNLKVSGTNHLLHQGFQALKKTNGEANTIVVGADVTHPGAGAQVGTPSIAAVVGTTDNEFMHFPGSMRLQRSRKEFIVELGDMVKERLIDWAKEHGWKLPARILFYRDGVSESQYEKIRTFEIPQIQRAFNWAQEYINCARPHEINTARMTDSTRNPWPQPTSDDGNGNQKFPDNTRLQVQFELTYVVVGKRHNTRFYPFKGENMLRTMTREGMNGNVAPGLVVDQVITHPYSLDFYLQSHQPLAGTGRSAHYFVIQNGMELSAKVLQKVTHEFCYAYARATKGVSYCAPAYYADRLCDRGRAYIRHWLTSKGDEPEHEPSREPDYQLETPEQYNDFVKNELRDSEYWRTNANREAVKYGFPRRNPWHPNLDEIMFYL